MHGLAGAEEVIKINDTQWHFHLVVLVRLVVLQLPIVEHEVPTLPPSKERRGELVEVAELQGGLHLGGGTTRQLRQPLFILDLL